MATDDALNIDMAQATEDIDRKVASTSSAIHLDADAYFESSDADKSWHNKQQLRLPPSTLPRHTLLPGLQLLAMRLLRKLLPGTNVTQ